MPSVVITGGARRIGGALARAFAQRGYDVGITYHTSADAAHATVLACTQAGVRATAQACDVADERSLVRAFDALVAEHGVPDVVVSNAGVFPDAMSVDALEADIIRRTIDVNTIPLVTLGKAYQRHIRATSGTGRLISISSLGAIETWRDRLPYNVSKSALLAAVHSLARSLAPSIAVNTVAPGAIRIIDEPTEADNAMSRVDRIPMGRHGTTDDIMDAVWFFATCSSYVTGQFLAVDGGYHLTR